MEDGDKERLQGCYNGRINLGKIVNKELGTVSEETVEEGGEHITKRSRHRLRTRWRIFRRVRILNSWRKT